LHVSCFSPSKTNPAYQLLGIILVSVSILRGVVVKSEWQTAAIPALFKVKVDSGLFLGKLIVWKSIFSSRQIRSHGLTKLTQPALPERNEVLGECGLSTHLCGLLLQTDTLRNGTKPGAVALSHHGDAAARGL
jgi:hypothetical protein